ncbi:MAG TPA: hypothetical protein VFC02_12520, partial [Anaerolineales bacterium]|nr:hypothetical protein [Anaerolineales bacterium]
LRLESGNRRGVGQCGGIIDFGSCGDFYFQGQHFLGQYFGYFGLFGRVGDAKLEKIIWRNYHNACSFQKCRSHFAEGPSEKE